MGDSIPDGQATEDEKKKRAYANCGERCSSLGPWAQPLQQPLHQGSVLRRLCWLGRFAGGGGEAFFVDLFTLFPHFFVPFLPFFFSLCEPAHRCCSAAAPWACPWRQKRSSWHRWALLLQGLILSTCSDPIHRAGDAQPVFGTARRQHTACCLLGCAEDGAASGQPCGHTCLCHTWVWPAGCCKWPAVGGHPCMQVSVFL